MNDIRSESSRSQLASARTDASYASTTTTTDGRDPDPSDTTLWHPKRSQLFDSRSHLRVTHSHISGSRVANDKEEELIRNQVAMARLNVRRRAAMARQQSAYKKGGGSSHARAGSGNGTTGGHLANLSDNINDMMARTEKSQKRFDDLEKRARSSERRIAEEELQLSVVQAQQRALERKHKQKKQKPTGFEIFERVFPTGEFCHYNWDRRFQTRADLGITYLVPKKPEAFRPRQYGEFYGELVDFNRNIDYQFDADALTRELDNDETLHAENTLSKTKDEDVSDLDPDLLAMLEENKHVAISKTDIQRHNVTKNHKRLGDQLSQPPQTQSLSALQSETRPAALSASKHGAHSKSAQDADLGHSKFRRHLKRATLAEEDRELDIDARINAIAAGHVDSSSDEEDVLTSTQVDPSTKWVRGGRSAHVL